ncbi:MAG: hypothetical protein HYR56_31495 [Acidobacteria bacterium]|nr:hypothetical protein [Acidobacteriota bacterium]
MVFASNPKLSVVARSAFDEGARGQALIHLPAIVLAELFYLNKKLGAPLDFPATFALLAASTQFVFVPFEAAETLTF